MEDDIRISFEKLRERRARSEAAVPVWCAVGAALAALVVAWFVGWRAA